MPQSPTLQTPKQLKKHKDQQHGLRHQQHEDNHNIPVVVPCPDPNAAMQFDVLLLLLGHKLFDDDDGWITDSDAADSCATDSGATDSVEAAMDDPPAGSGATSPCNCDVDGDIIHPIIPCTHQEEGSAEDHGCERNKATRI